MTTKLEVFGGCAGENPSERSALGADLSGSDASSLRKDSDRQGVALDECESSEGGCIGSKTTTADDSCKADDSEATPTRPRSAPTVRSLPQASPPRKQVGASCTGAGLVAGLLLNT